MKDLVSNFMDECNECMEETMLDAVTDELLKLTITEAARYSKVPKGLHVRKALQIRAGAFLIASSLSMQGEENLGVPECPHRTPSYFKYPLPTVLEYQIDTMAINVMKGHLGTALKHLKSLISKGKPREVWYEAFLLIFVLISTLEFVYQKQLEYVVWHEATVCLSTARVLSLVNSHSTEPGNRCEICGLCNDEGVGALRSESDHTLSIRAEGSHALHQGMGTNERQWT